jgi:RNA polymerase sigma-70 factor, ECF subfamily
VTIPETDNRTINRCIAGDMASCRMLYEAHKDVLFNIAFRMHRNRMDAEDSVQEAFVRIFKFLPGFKGECRFSTWACKILINACLSSLRKNAPRVESLDRPGTDGSERLSDGNRNPAAGMILEQEIANLSTGFRTVFVLHEVEGFSHGEIAQMLDITEGTSKSQLFKARRILQKKLRPFMDILETDR